MILEIEQAILFKDSSAEMARIEEMATLIFSESFHHNGKSSLQVPSSPFQGMALPMAYLNQ